MPNHHGFATRTVHAGEAPDPSTGAHGVPLYQNVTYAFRSYEQLESMRAGGAPHFVYQPRGNPTVRCLELKLANLEGAETAIATSSGMSAISATLISLLAGGGHVVASTDLFDETRNFLLDDLAQAGGSVTWVNATDLNAVAAAIAPETRAIYIEAISNPCLSVADLTAISGIAREHGVLLLVDNTFLSPALLRPIEHGADIVLHSATKYLSGHGMVQGGIISGSRELLDPIRAKVSRLGGTQSPFGAWTLLSGIKTLPLRMARQSTNAASLACLLASHPAVATVNYPGLPDHPGHEIATRMVGSGDDRFGGMISFSLRCGTSHIGRLINALQLCTLAVSLGDCSTLIWPFAGTDLIRLSVGIEDPADLAADIRTALDGLSDRQ